MTGFKNKLDQNVEAHVDVSGFLGQIEYAHARVHEGVLYEVHWESLDLDIASPKTVLIQTGSKTVHLFYELASIGARVQFQLFEGPTITAESESGEIIPANLNRDLAAAAVALGVKFYGTFTATNDGTEIAGAKRQILGSSGGVSRVNASSRQSAERVLKANTKYLLRATSAANDAVFTFDGTFNEI
jgi:hypothetical protein